MDISNFVPVIAAWLGIAPSSLTLLVVALVAVANAVSRLIPDDATGALNALRLVCKFIGMNVNSRVSSGVTVNDVTKAAASFPEVQAKIADKS